jgi:hypothetical protein
MSYRQQCTQSPGVFQGLFTRDEDSGLTHNGVFRVFVGQLGGLAGPLTEIIQFGSASFAASGRLDADYIGRMDGEYAFDAFACDNPADREGRIDAPAFAGDYRSGKYAYPLLVSFLYPAGNVHCVPDFKVRYILLQALAFDLVQQHCLHCFNS